VKTDNQAQEQKPIIKYFKYLHIHPRGIEEQRHPIVDLPAFLREYGYTRLDDHIPGRVELWDRLKEQELVARYLVIVHTKRDEQPYTCVFAIEDFEHLMLFLDGGPLFSIPLLPQILYRFHGIRL
jgi:hypothetical protein